MSEKITESGRNELMKVQREKGVVLRNVILYLHNNQMSIRESMKDDMIIAKITSRIYHDRLVGINEAIYDESLEMSERVNAYFTDENDAAYGRAIAYRFGLSLTQEQAIGYDVLKYRGDMRITLNEDDLVNFARYLYSLGAVATNPKFVPATDGVNHINIYSKGKSSVGRILSNFHTPEAPYVTDHGVFRSLEGYYHWLRVAEYHHVYCGETMGTLEIKYPELKRLRTIDGDDAIRYGRTCKSNAYAKTSFRPGKLDGELFLSFARALTCKLFRQYVDGANLGEYVADLLTTKFGLVHYYNTADGVKYPKHGEWLPELIMGICSHIDPAGGTTTEQDILKLLPVIIGD